MKKALLFIVFAMLLLLASCGEKKEADISTLGNTPGNILLDGEVAEDDEFVYYTTDHGGKEIYKAKKDFSEKTKIAECRYGANYLNVSGDHLYFIDGYPGYVYKMNKNGGFKRPIILKQTTNVIISGDRIYYKLTPSDGIFFKIEQYADDWGSIYSCNLNGRDKKLIVKEKISEFSVDGETIYYTNSEDGNSLWAIDTSEKNKRKLNSEYTFSPNFDDEYIYYVTTESFNVFRMNKKTLKVECISDESCNNMNLSGDWIYYSQRKYNGHLCRVSKDGKVKEVILDEPAFGINFAANSVFYLRQGEDPDRYRLDLENKEITKV